VFPVNEEAELETSCAIAQQAKRRISIRIFTQLPNQKRRKSDSDEQLPFDCGFKQPDLNNRTFREVVHVGPGFGKAVPGVALDRARPCYIEAVLT
jgi:hypothetical protein